MTERTMSKRAMARVVGLAAAALLGVVGSAAAQSSAERVAGYWQCENDGSGAATSGKVEYAAEGSVSYFGVAESLPGAEYSFRAAFHGVGAWRIDGAELVEEITAVTLLEFALNEEYVAPSALQAEFDSDMLGERRSVITTLDATTLVLGDGRGRTRCTRL